MGSKDRGAFIVIIRMAGVTILIGIGQRVEHHPSMSDGFIHAMAVASVTVPTAVFASMDIVPLARPIHGVGFIMAGFAG